MRRCTVICPFYGRVVETLVIFLIGIAVVLCAQPVSAADDLPVSEMAKLFGTNYAIGTNPTPEQASRMQGLAKRFLKTREANYPQMFAKAGEEFKVPVDVLMGVAFVQTRWSHPDWSEQSLDQPEAFGIMALRGSGTLPEAAKLIDRKADELKREAYQNIRGAAALLRKCYDITGKPENDTESWCAAVVEYFNRCESPMLCCCGEDWALRIFTAINEGYQGEGIEWSGHRLDLTRINIELETLRSKRVLARIRAGASYQGHTNSFSSTVTAVTNPD